MHPLDQRTLVSFVHGYQNLDITLGNGPRPALWSVQGDVRVAHSYPFPRAPEDFAELGDVIRGTQPGAEQPSFKRLPRFGLTGLSVAGDRVYAGSWNGVYVINRDDLSLEGIISHEMMSDMHGIWAEEDHVVTVLTPRDTVVITDLDGNVVEHFRVHSDLSITTDSGAEGVDWRFVGKQFRGSTGYWHFNYVQRIDGELWLTSRNANCFVVVDPVKRTARLKLMNLCTPALLHDGRKVGSRFFFTSIDGKVIIASPHLDQHHTHQELDRVEAPGVYLRDMVSKLIRLEETSLGREPNWCRGIAVADEVIQVTIDGRYDTDLSFGLLAINEQGEVLRNARYRWEEAGDPTELRYVTGFDVEVA
ncbi:MAG: hypothetical protein ACE366_12215 [Bradymonadia bacterium]